MKQILLIFVLLLSGITNAQTFDFSCSSPTEDLISDRLAELNAIADEATYTHVEGAYHNEQETAYGFRVIRTTSDGSEIDYFGDAGQGYGISKASLGSEDTSGPAGWDKYLADAKLAVVNSEIDGAAAALAMTADELASLTASRTLELKAKGSATTSVTIRWDGGHIITVDGNDILARDHGHNNYGKSTQDQFDALLKVVEDAVIAADAAANLSVGDSRKKQLEDLSRDGVFVHVTNGGGEYKIEFTDSEDNPYGHIEGWEPVTISGLVNLEDISESNFTTYTLVQTENIITDILNGKYIIESITYDAFTVSEIDLATSAASTLGVLVDWEYGNFDEDHSLKGQQYVNVVLTDLTENLSYNFTNQFLNGGTSLEDGTKEEFDAWVLQWPSFITSYQAPIRSAYKQKLEAAFVDAMPAEETDVVIALDSDENGDIITFKNVAGTISTIPIRFNEIIEDLPVATIDAAINLLPGYIAELQYEIAAAAKIIADAAALRMDYISQIDTFISNEITASDFSIVYSNSDNYGGTGDALVFVDPNGEVGENIYGQIQFNGLFEEKSQFEIDYYLDKVKRVTREHYIKSLENEGVEITISRSTGFDIFTITGNTTITYGNQVGTEIIIEDVDNTTPVYEGFPETALDILYNEISNAVTQAGL